jgi:uncharacterized protein YyaL (SSP411 family)
VRNYREGPSAVAGFADDYAFLIQGLLDLYEASFEIDWLRFAIDLQETQDRSFYDAENGGYFSGAGNDPSILLRLKEDNDGAEPGRQFYRGVESLEARPNSPRRCHAAARPPDHLGLRRDAVADACRHAADARRRGHQPEQTSQIVIAGEREEEGTRALLSEVHRQFAPGRIIILADGGEGQQFLQTALPELDAMRPLDGRATAYVCENFACQAPVTEPAALRELLAG